MPFISLAIGVILAVADQFFKILVANNLKPIGTVSIFGDVFKLTYVENRGVAFGMFKDMPWLFIVITTILLAAIIIYMFKKHPENKFFYITAALIIGGGLGNLIDRMIYGYVIDYLSLSFFPPVCNFADYCITVGVILFAVYLLFLSDTFDSKKVKKHD